MYQIPQKKITPSVLECKCVSLQIKNLFYFRESSAKLPSSKQMFSTYSELQIRSIKK